TLLKGRLLENPQDRKRKPREGRWAGTTVGCRRRGMGKREGEAERTGMGMKKAPGEKTLGA
ncbi:MAG: hypothetical protein IJ335_08785, partial [Lachnospiraceae bacterium]|nr:hypothetical protein [Lachnospiraceae bacterium]